MSAGNFWIELMGINDYIEKLRAKPQKQREKIAVIATALSFILIFSIWLVSFSETNKSSNSEQAASATDGLEDLKNSVSGDKKSIEEMMQGMSANDAASNPQSQLPTDEQATNDGGSAPGENSAPGAQAPGDSDKAGIPQLP